ncbi:MAG: IS110 family transposase [Caulobacteraceae bacterium]
MIIHPGFVGIDVSKHHLDVFDARTGASMHIPYSPAAVAALSKRLAASGEIAIFEATGGYDRRLREALVRAGVPHVRVNPARARAFARAAGFLAKTDKVDAKMLAVLGQALKPAPDAEPDPERQRLSDLVKRRDQLVAMRAQERARASECLERELKADIAAHLAWLDARVAGALAGTSRNA